MQAAPQVSSIRRPAPEPVVLVIEDEPRIAELIRHALQHGDYRIIAVDLAAVASSYPITEIHLPELGLFARHVAIAVENVYLHQEPHDRAQQVSLLLKTTIDAQEEERERICLEIHDGVTQTLTAASHYLQSLVSQPELADTMRPSLNKAAMLVRTAIREAREVIATLRPAVLDTLGLTAALRYELDELRAQTGWQVDFEADEVRFSKAIEIALYRIVHEAITNIIKHAHARKVVVRVKQKPGYIIVDVEDDGVGFDLPALERQVRSKGVGLLSMWKRVELVQGNFTISSSPGQGTQVRVEVPLPV